MSDAGDPPTIPKPDALLALHDVTTELFDVLREWFEVPTKVKFDLAAVDSAVRELGDPRLIAAFAMRKLQALHLLATPGVMTTTDVVVAIVSDLDRALLQAPSMRLRLAAATTDWDAELAALDATALPGVTDAADADPATERFRELHTRLHDAVVAVLDVSDGEIRFLI